MRSLFDGAGQTISPCFTVAELNAISPAGFDLFRTAKVLVKMGVPEEMAHPVHGHVAIRKVAGQWYLVSLSDPARDWIKVDAAEVERFRFSHQGLVRWIARQCGTRDEVNSSGEIWTVGDVIVLGRRCRVLYYPGMASMEKLLAAVRALEAEDPVLPRLLLLPFTLPIEAAEQSRLESRGLFLDHVYRLISGNGIDLDLVRLPVAASSRKPGYFFRRGKGKKSWEVGFNTPNPTGVPYGVAMDRIWLLLRNPRKEFTAAEIADELNGLSPDRSHNGKAESNTPAHYRSKGSRGKNLRDLTNNQRLEGKDIHAEMMSAKAEFGESSLQFREAEDAWDKFRRQHGLPDIHAGMVKRENNDEAKESEAMRRSIDRWIEGHRGGDLDGLAKYLGERITRGAKFSYNPPLELPWQT